MKLKHLFVIVNLSLRRFTSWGFALYTRNDFQNTVLNSQRLCLRQMSQKLVTSRSLRFSPYLNIVEAGSPVNHRLYKREFHKITFFFNSQFIVFFFFFVSFLFFLSFHANISAPRQRFIHPSNRLKTRESHAGANARM